MTEDIFGIINNSSTFVVIFRLLDLFLNSLINVFMEKYGSDATEQGERQVYVELCKSLSATVKDLLHDGAKSNSWIQWCKIVIGSAYHEHGSHVGRSNDESRDCWVIRHLGLVLGLSQIQESKEEGANHFGNNGLPYKR